MILISYLTNASAYHDPDLNYHLDQLQTLQNCANGGYNYPVPSVQLSTSGVKHAISNNINQALVRPSYAYSTKTSGYAANIAYQNPIHTNSLVQANYQKQQTDYPVQNTLYQVQQVAHPVQQATLPVQHGLYPVQHSAYQAQTSYPVQQSFYPVHQSSYSIQPATYSVQESSYSSQPATSYAKSEIASIFNSRKEGHGYITSAGLSSYTNRPRTVTPLATYAQAPIIAKITAAPLIAKYAAAPVKSFLNQNQFSQSSASVAINSQETSGPVVSQVIAAPRATYATSPTLRAQTSIVNSLAAKDETSNNQISSTHLVSAVPQFSAQFANHASGHFAAPVAQVAPVIQQYVVPSIQTQAQTSGQYTSSVVQGGSNTIQYSSPVIQVASPILSHATASAHSVPPAVTKNVHAEFLENYVSTINDYYE